MHTFFSQGVSDRGFREPWAQYICIMENHVRIKECLSYAESTLDHFISSTSSQFSLLCCQSLETRFNFSKTVLIFKLISKINKCPLSF